MLKLQGNHCLQILEISNSWHFLKRRRLMPHLALIAEGTELETVTNIRIHSECITGEIFTLENGMRTAIRCCDEIYYEKRWNYFALSEGSHYGINKIKSIPIARKGFDTVEANLKLGLPADDRDFNRNRDFGYF